MASIQVLTGQLYKGLKMFREPIQFIGGIKNSEIVVYYYEYLSSPTGDKVDEKWKKYFVKDIPAVYEERKTAEGVPYQFLITPENLGYTQWRKKEILQLYVGLKLGEDLIIGSIMQKLSTMPFEVADDHITNPNE